jgi:hypothetical protein
VPTAEVAQLIKEVRRNGFAVEAAEGGIFKVLWKGEPVYKHEQDGGTPLMIHGTPSDVRWRKNMVPVLIRAKVLDRDPWSNHTEKKITVTPVTSRSFLEKQLIPWIQRRLDEGFTKSVLANAIHTRWPNISATEAALVQQLSNIMASKQKGLRTKSYESWKEVVEGWSKQPALPPQRRESKDGSTNGELLQLAAPEKKSPRSAKPELTLSARCLAMMMDSYPDRDEALLTYLELVELEDRVYA